MTDVGERTREKSASASAGSFADKKKDNSMPTFEPKILNHYLCPHGMQVIARIAPTPSKEPLVTTVEKIVPEEDWYHFRVTGWLFQRWNERPVRKSCTIRIPLPRVEADGRFWLGDRERVVVRRCYRDLQAPADEVVYRFDSPAQVLLSELQKAFASIFRDFYFTGTPPSNEAARDKVRRIFATSLYCPVLDNHPVARKSLGELVYMDIPEGLNLEQRRFPVELWGILDPSSTSQGTKINRVYRLCQGVQIDRFGLAHKSGIDHCSTLANNAIAVDFNPLRTMLLRTTFEQAMELENEERPWIAGQMHEVPGIHLLTALMDLKDKTFEDCVVVSESAAQRMTAMRHNQEFVETFSRLELKVRPGDHVERSTILGEGLDQDGERRTFRAEKIYGPGWINNITVCQTWMMGRPALRYRFFYTRRAELEVGDKVTTRAGTKGVVWIVKDHLMPKMADGRTVECCVSPLSVIGRKAMLVLWEMMVNRHQLDLGQRIVITHGKQIRIKDLLEQAGYAYGFQNLSEVAGDKEQLYYRREKLPEPTFVAPLFWIRLDKLAKEIACVQTGEQPLNRHGVAIASGRRSGQMRDLAKTIALKSRGLHHNLTHSIRENMTGVEQFAKVAAVLEPERFA
jgi:hypothetical protein